MEVSSFLAALLILLPLLIIITTAVSGRTDDRDPAAETDIPESIPVQTRELFGRICDAMESSRLYLDPELRMEDLIAICGSNRSYISSCINQITGLTFPAFVNSYRVHYAQMLLSEAGENTSIGDIALQCGYGSHSAFTRNFKKMTGISPSEWVSQG